MHDLDPPGCTGHHHAFEPADNPDVMCSCGSYDSIVIEELPVEPPARSTARLRARDLAAVTVEREQLADLARRNGLDAYLASRR